MLAFRTLHAARALGAIFALAACTAFAQDFPTKALRIVVPYPPGGASDVTARVLGQKLAEAWNQQVVVDNRPGANGILALEHVAKQPADGHVLLMANLGPNAINPAVYPKLPYDPLKDFSAVTLTTMVPQVLVVSAASDFRTLKDFLDRARAEPGKLAYGTGGNGSANHLGVELMASIAGVKLSAVPYKGDAPAMTDLMSGRVNYFFNNPVSVIAQAKGGKVRALAVTGETRLAAIPDVPTMAQVGFPGFETVGWFAFFVHAKVPRPIAEKLHGALSEIILAPDMKAFLAERGTLATGIGLDEFGRKVAAERAAWAKLIKENEIRLD